MKIIKILNPVAHENTYLLSNDQAILVIDPGSDGQAILAQIKALKQPVAAILLTHAHYDHIMSVDLIRQECQQPPVYISEKEASWLYQPLDNLSGLDRHSDMEDVVIGAADYYFDDERSYEIADFHFQVVKTPGHSWGGVSFIFPKEACVFSGDALFKETIGRSDLPTGNFDELIESIQTQLFTLPKHYTVYPGHGGTTTIAHEKNVNPYFS